MTVLVEVDLWFEPEPGNVAHVGRDSRRLVDRREGGALVQTREALDWKGGVGLNEFGVAGKEAGDLVVAGGRPAPVCATNMTSAVVASMICLGVLGLGRSFHLGG